MYYRKKTKLVQFIFISFLIISLTSCFYWLRAFQTYLQMKDFDQNFAIVVDDQFQVHFKKPLLYSEDIFSLLKLQPSSIKTLETRKIWRLLFQKIDEEGNISQPPVKFFFDLEFDQQDRLNIWSFSPLFLHIAPAEFLEVSFRSLGTATINRDKRQLKADTSLVKKISADLPKKNQVIAQLGKPLSIKNKDNQEIYRYHFQLKTDDIEDGYEDRALNVINLTFDNKSSDLIKMAGRFAGLKISIDYCKFTVKQSGCLDNKQE